MRISDWSSTCALPIFRLVAGAKRPLQGWTGHQYHIEGCLRRDRRHAARPICRIACPSPQPGDEHGAQRRVTCGDRRHVAPPVAGFDADLCEAGYRRSAFDRTTMAGSGRGNMSLSHDLEHYIIVSRITEYDTSTAATAGHRLAQTTDM